MAEPRNLKTRIINKHATAAVWNTKTSFIPLQAELIIYDKDSEYPFERYKIGDGSTPVTQLPFVINPHEHQFRGTTGTATATYTPAGSVTVTHNPKGTVSDVVVGVESTVKKMLVATSEGTNASYSPGSCTFPVLNASESEGVLTLDVSGGSYTPGEFTPGTKPTLAEISYVESIVVNIDEPVFTGTEETINGIFTGTPATIESTYTPEGTVDESE